jgi:hypothetical protein
MAVDWKRRSFLKSWAIYKNGRSFESLAAFDSAFRESTNLANKALEWKLFKQQVCRLLVPSANCNQSRLKSTRRSAPDLTQSHRSRSITMWLLHATASGS